MRLPNITKQTLRTICVAAALACAVPGSAELINLSTRGEVGTGDGVLIGGLVLEGTGEKTLLIRAVGPGIDPVLVAPALQLADPQIELFRGAERIDQNDDWADHVRADAIPAGLRPSRPQEAAIIATLSAGEYTAIVRGTGETTGIALIEVFEITPGGPRLVNLSTRGVAHTGDRVLIGGLVIDGNDPVRVVIRAVGPSIDPALVAPEDHLVDPRLTLHADSGEIDANDNWQDAAAVLSLPESLYPATATESVIVRTLAPGAYTAILSGAGGGTGVALVEIFALDPVDPGIETNLPLTRLSLPDGFDIVVWAEVPNARQMAAGGDGIVYVGSMDAGRVYAVLDHEPDGRVDAVRVIASGLQRPSGVAWRGGDLFVGAMNRVLRYRNIDARTDAPPAPEVVTDRLPDAAQHGWKVLGFGPEGQLYLNIGAPCNVCESADPLFATIVRLDVDDPGEPEIVARGVRNSVGFDWHPQTGDLWFTDNGRDWLGDHAPPDELNVVRTPGAHFGFPYFHGAAMADPQFGGGRDVNTFRAPALELGPHVAALGMAFYRGHVFPADFSEQLLIAEHGSWNRSAAAGHTGYRITLARDRGGALTYETFIDGWLTNNVAWGRPVDVLGRPDGSLLISDDRAGVLYRVSYR